LKWIYALLLVAAALAGARIFFKLRSLGAQHADDWDERLVKNLRAQGGNAFTDYAVDFFFGVSSLEGCQQIATALRDEGCTVDFREANTEGASGYSLHAQKTLRISLPEMQAHSARYRALAAQYQGRYDGWATEGVTQIAASNQRLRARGVPPSAYQRDLNKLK
jgi:hypothetical protein